MFMVIKLSLFEKKNFKFLLIFRIVCMWYLNKYVFNFYDFILNTSNLISEFQIFYCNLFISMCIKINFFIKDFRIYE